MKMIDLKINDTFKFLDKPKKTFIVEEFNEFRMWYRNVKGNKEKSIQFDQAEKIDIQLIETVK